MSFETNIMENFNSEMENKENVPPCLPIVNQKDNSKIEGEFEKPVQNETEVINSQDTKPPSNSEQDLTVTDSQYVFVDTPDILPDMEGDSSNNSSECSYDKLSQDSDDCGYGWWLTHVFQKSESSDCSSTQDSITCSDYSAYLADSEYDSENSCF